MSGLPSNRAQLECEHQTRIDAFQRSKEDGFPQRLAKRSKLPVGELAEVIHGPNAPSLHTSNRSKAGGSIRDSSKAAPASVAGSEAPESHSPAVFGPQSRRRRHDSIHEAPSSRSGRTENGTTHPLTGSPSSCISDLSVLDGISERGSDKSMRLLQDDGTVRPSFFQQAPVLECPGSRIIGCGKVFPISDSEKWVAHTQEHLFLKKGGRRGPKHISPPTSNSCVFCDEKFQADSGESSWSNMMAHVKVHHMFGHRLAHARIDWSLVEYLWEKGLLTPAQYRELKPSRHAGTPPGLSDDEDPIALVEERRHRGGQ